MSNKVSLLAYMYTSTRSRLIVSIMIMCEASVT